MLRQAENYVKIEGILSEIDIQPRPFKRNGVEVDAIGGSITVKVVQTINGEDKELMVPVHMFASRLKRDGGLNPAYESIKTVANEFKSIGATGSEDTADRVRITGASIKMNEYYAGDGHLVSFPRINGSFVNRIPKGDCKPEASFTLEFAVAQMGEETDANGELTGRYKVTALVPQYGGVVDVVPMYAINPNVTSGISSFWEPERTYKAHGKLDFSAKTETILEEVDFGEPIEKIRTTNTSDLIITGGSQEPKDEDFEFKKADLDAGLAERKNKLEKQKDKDMSRTVSKSTPSANTSNGWSDLGF